MSNKIVVPERYNDTAYTRQAGVGRNTCANNQQLEIFWKSQRSLICHLIDEQMRTSSLTTTNNIYLKLRESVRCLTQKAAGCRQANSAIGKFFSQEAKIEQIGKIIVIKLASGAISNSCSIDVIRKYLF